MKPELQLTTMAASSTALIKIGERMTFIEWHLTGG
jgi:hypothetical protein